MKVAGVVQARLGSTRLPRKVLLPLNGKPMIAQIAERLSLVRSLDCVVAAIPLQDEDLLAACASARLLPIRGSESDLISRFLCVFDALGVDAVCRITADCALVDAAVVDLVVTRWREHGGDYCSNVYPRRTYPDGLDVEVISRDALVALDRMTRAKSWLSAHDARESFTQTFWERPGLFRVHGVERESDGLDRLQWSVNTPAEYRGARIVYDTLEPGFTWEQVLKTFGPIGLDEIT